MLIDINKITIENRIRSEFGNIEELANDIKENGLINPPVVTPEYVLIAGERRVRAMRLLGWKQIEINLMTVRDYEHQLKLEISENENRKEFTYTERIAWAKKLEQVEKIKAKERMGQGVENFPQHEGKTRDKVAEESGFGSGKQYEKAKFVAENADSKTLEDWNNGDISTHKAYTEIQAKLKASEERVARLQKSLEDELTKPPVVETKTIEVVKTPPEITKRLIDQETELTALKATSHDRDQKLDQLTKERDILDRKSKLNESEAKEYAKLKEQIKHLSLERDDITRQIESATALSGLVVEVKHLVDKIAPGKLNQPQLLAVLWLRLSIWWTR